MILWLVPGALAALALLAGPFVVHLLARRHARRVIFPASHFVRPMQAAAVRFRRPTDIGLLLLRLAIVAAAALAAARPLVLTPWRLAQWDARTSRAVVVDTSRSMPSPDAASALAAKEATDVFRSDRIDTADLGAGLRDAARWLSTVPPSRREVVVISDFQQGAIDRDGLRALPEGVGVRFIRAGTLPAERRGALTPVDHWRGGRWKGSMAIDGRGVSTAWTRTGAAGLPAWLAIAAASADASAADRALRAAASFGLPAGDDSRRAVVIFTGGDADGPPNPVRDAWMVDAALALRQSGLLRDTGVDVAVEDRGGRLAVRAPVTAASPAASAVIRAVILAMRPSTIADPELDTRAIPDSDLASWRRDPSPLTGSAAAIAPTLGQSAEGEGQARWLWVLALVLLGVESAARRARRQAAPQEARADAA